MKRTWPLLSLALALGVALAACGDDDDDNPGTQGSGGKSGTGGTGGKSGTGGTGGSAGTGGASGTGGSAGTGGTAGISGSAGTGGTGGVAGASGTGGVAGAAGSGGSDGKTLAPFTLAALCKSPESAYFDAGTNAWYVSCQEGPAGTDGHIAKVTEDGTKATVANLNFITGLSDPKGIRVHDGKLYVSDVSKLVIANVADGSGVANFSAVGVGGADAIAEALLFLNDVAVDPANDKIYVSDTPNNAIFRFDADGGNATLVVKDPQIEAPNGLLVRDEKLLIAAFGPGIDRENGFITDKLGAVIAVPLATVNDLGDGVTLAAGSFAFISQRVGNLDGLEIDGNGDLVLTDFFGGRLFTVDPTADAPGSTPGFDQGDATPVQNGFNQSADHGFDPSRRLVAVPETGNGNLRFIDLGP
ncbi:MAG TPA: hypothetical protein VFS00_34625 [Polyangiaceae bacterium]|nr:hypothetical protein [Polyangiaceae bacterium]